MKMKKSKEIKIRCTESIFRKLLAISKVTGKSRTAVITDLINLEYERDRRYSIQYYADLDKKL